MNELQKAKEDATTMLANQEYTYKSQIINAYYKFYGHKVMHQKGNATNNFTDTSMPPSEMEDIFAGKSYIDLETQFENEEFMKEFDTGYMDARLNQLHSEVVEAQKLAAKSGEEYQAAQTLAEESYMDAVSSTISSKHNKASKGIQSAFEGVKNANKNPKKLIRSFCTLNNPSLNIAIPFAIKAQIKTKIQGKKLQSIFSKRKVE